MLVYMDGLLLQWHVLVKKESPLFILFQPNKLVDYTKIKNWHWREVGQQQAALHNAK